MGLSNGNELRQHLHVVDLTTTEMDHPVREELRRLHRPTRVLFQTLFVPQTCKIPLGSLGRLQSKETNYCVAIPQTDDCIHNR